MLDTNPAKLTQFGTVTIEGGGRIYVEGFSAEGGSCRDVAALVVVWAIGRLQQELMATLEKPGGGNVCIG